MTAVAGIDRRALLERGFTDAPFVNENGIRLTDIGAGWCEATVEIAPHHLQQTGVVHAGLLTTLADHCAGAAAFTLTGPDAMPLTTSINVSLLRAAQGARLRCRAEVTRAGRQVSFAEASIWSVDANGENLAARAAVVLAVANRR